jgi:hypothetical protein
MRLQPLWRALFPWMLDTAYAGRGEAQEQVADGRRHYFSQRRPGTVPMDRLGDEHAESIRSRQQRFLQLFLKTERRIYGLILAMIPTASALQVIAR